MSRVLMAEVFPPPRRLGRSMGVQGCLGVVLGKPSWCGEGSWGAVGGGDLTSVPGTQPSRSMKFGCEVGALW